MRKEHTLSSQFAIIGLDGQPALQYCAAKAAVVRGIAAAAFLDKILFWQKEAWAGETFSAELTTALERVRKLKKKEAQRLEKDMVAGLVADGAMEIIPDLLGCDMDYVTARGRSAPCSPAWPRSRSWNPAGCPAAPATPAG